MKFLVTTVVLFLTSFLPSTTNAGKQIASVPERPFKSPFWPSGPAEVKTTFDFFQGSLSVMYPSLITAWEFPLDQGAGGPGSVMPFMRVSGTDPFNVSSIELDWQLGGVGVEVSIDNIVHNENGENSVQIYGHNGTDAVYYKAKYTTANPGYAQLTGRVTTN